MESSVISLVDDNQGDSPLLDLVGLPSRNSGLLQASDSDILLQSVFTISDVPYSVRLTKSDITCQPVGLDQGDLGFRQSRQNRDRIGRLNRGSGDLGDGYQNIETVYYQPSCGGDNGYSAPVLLLPSRSLSGSEPCYSSDNEELGYSSSSETWCLSKRTRGVLRARPLQRYCDISKQAVKLKEVLAVTAAQNPRPHDVSQGVGSSFVIYTVRRLSRHRWRHCKLVLHHTDSSVVALWIEQIKSLLALPEFSRPKSLLVFVNPISGSKNAVKLYRRTVAPLFDIAGISTEVIYTERQNHARDILMSYDLGKFDGIISVGGDGMFSEIVHGLLTRVLRHSGVDQLTTDTPLPQPQWRVGIIPAGSTDTVSYSLHGSNDIVTAALHVVVGDGLAMDVGTVFHNKQFMKFNISFLGYGYYGDTIVDSERNRWMGPKRYDWEGFKKVLANRSYDGEISFLPSKTSQYHPRDGIPCVARCHVCQSHLSPPSSSSSTNVSSASKDRRVSGDNIDEGWQKIKGRFVAINSFLISCRCRYALQGPAPCAHLGDGCSDLVLVHKCSRVEYLQHLIRCTDPNKDQFDFPFIQTFRVTQFRFRPFVDDGEDPPLTDAVDSSTLRIDIGASGSAQRLRGGGSTKISAWNCDGEPISQPSVECRIHRQVIRLFARGIEEGLTASSESTSQCCECC